MERNRQIVLRLIDATLFLGRQGLPFRGHREYAGLGAPDINKGNFLELLKFLAHYDAIIGQHLNTSAGHISYLSHQTQNELITAIASEIMSTIINDVKTAGHFSVIVDSTIDIAKVDQLSLSIRHVTKAGEPIERFIKFAELPDSSAESFYNILTDTLINELGLDVKLMRGQAYDGARTMSGHFSGLQARVKEHCSEKAIYVHCCAHNLNLILMDAVCSLSKAKLFFGTLETLYAFLTSSLPRYKILQEEQQKKLDGAVLTLKRLSDTRWASRKQATDAVIQSLPAILEALQRIIDHTNTSPKTASDAEGLLTK